MSYKWHHLFKTCHSPRAAALFSRQNHCPRAPPSYYFRAKFVPGKARERAPRKTRSTQVTRDKKIDRSEALLWITPLAWYPHLLGRVWKSVQPTGERRDKVDLIEKITDEIPERHASQHRKCYATVRLSVLSVCLLLVTPCPIIFDLQQNSIGRSICKSISSTVLIFLNT